MEPLVIYCCHGEYISYSVVAIVDYHSILFYGVFSDGLSKSTNAAMANGITSTGDLPPYVLDRLFDSFSDEYLLMLMIKTTMMLPFVGELYIDIQLCSACNCKNFEIMVAILDCWLP